MQETGFCCTGCAYVHRLVAEHGLSKFYRIKDPVTAPTDPAVFQPRDYTWLGEAQAQAEDAIPAPGIPCLTLGIQGISCAGCVWLIERLYGQQRGARDVVVNAQLGTMHLRWVRGEFSAVDFARRLQSFGYLTGPSDSGADGPASRGMATRIGLCAAFAMNVMLFTLPTYFGMAPTSEYARLFSLLSAVFATLSFLVGGTYFLRRAAQALREGAVHIDLPIALGVIGAYVGSLAGWLLGDARFVYFDFVSAFILLMLVGRWAQVAAVERNRRRLLSLQPVPQRVRVVAPDGLISEVPPQRISNGQVLIAAPGQVVPVDSRLDAATADFSLASINGEAEARTFRHGQRVPGGSVCLSLGGIRLVAQQPWGESLLAQLTAPASRGGWHQRFLESVIRVYLVSTIAVAALAGLGWWLSSGDVQRTWSVVISVLVVSCPCAIGLAIPLADEIATVAVRRHGVFVREGDLWARLGHVRKLVFDKTGTLTLECPELENPQSLRALDHEARCALLALVRDNPHPVSQSLCGNLLADGAHQPADGDIRETVGMGVEITAANGRTWSLGRPGWTHAGAGHGNGSTGQGDDGTSAILACDGRAVARFSFSDRARPDAQAELAALSSQGYATYILSGDRSSKVAALAAELGLPAGRCLGELSPQGKADWLCEHGAGDALMLGDGANDSLAFNQALCRGTPVIHRGLLEQKADFYYLGRGIAGIRALFEVNATRRRVRGVILAFSVAYNLVVVGLAVTGRVNPLVAAVLMPASSLATLAIVGLGMRRALTMSRRD